MNHVVVLAVESDTVNVALMDDDARLQIDDAMVLYPPPTMRIPTRLLDVYCGRFDRDILHNMVCYMPMHGLKRGVDRVPVWMERELEEHVLRFVHWHKLCGRTGRL